MVPELSYLIYPMLAAVPLVMLYSYLGLHVLRREIIFIDIAIAQISVLGLTFALFLGYPPKGGLAQLFAFIFSLGGALIFTVAKPQGNQVSQEAIIGIAYVAATGAAILLVDMAKDPHGAEYIRHTLVGNLAWVSPKDVGYIFLSILPIGLFHLIFAKKFYAITFESREQVRGHLLWDFLFYLTFGIAVTSSVSVCGVLLVFSFLVIPSTCASLLSSRFVSQLFIAWGIGIGGTLLGLFLSWNRPSGPVIISLLTLVLVVIGLVRLFQRAEKKQALGYMTVLLLPVVLIGLLLVMYPPPHSGEGHLDQKKTHAHGKVEEGTEGMERALEELDPFLSLAELSVEVEKLSPSEREAWKKEALKKLGQRHSWDEVLLYCKVLLALREFRCLPHLLELLEKAPQSMLRDEAWQSLRSALRLPPMLDPYEDEPEERRKEVEKVRQWLQKRQLLK